MTAISVRDLRDDELDWLIETERAVFGPAAWHEETVRRDFAVGPTRYRAIECDGALAGYSVYGYDGDAFSLLNLVVLEVLRGRGAGTAAVADVFAEARREGATEVWLEVAVDNEAAVSLYRTSGFEEVRRRPRYYQPGDIDAIVMRASVPGGGAA